MKILLFAVVLTGGVAMAQNVDVNSIDADNEGTTTIEIKKSKTQEEKKKENEWEISDGSAELEGDPATTAKEARVSWKTACDAWKKEFRQDNKENKILAISCGTASCGGEAGAKTCVSKATYKIKTRVN